MSFCCIINRRAVISVEPAVQPVAVGGLSVLEEQSDMCLSAAVVGNQYNMIETKMAESPPSRTRSAPNVNHFPSRVMLWLHVN